MPQLDPYWILSQVFWLALSFAALYFVMARVGLPRLGSVLLTRREQIEGDLQVAEAARIQSDVLAQQNEVQIKSARSRAAEVVSEIQKEAEALAVARNADLDKVLHRKMADAQIAAICLSQVATLATRNTKHFEGLGLTLINPWRHT